MKGFTTTPLLPVTVCLMTGIVAGSEWQPAFPLLWVLLAAIATTLACHRHAVVQTVAVLACCATLGMTLAQMQGRGVEDVEGRELHGVVMSEPALKPKTVSVDVLVPDRGSTLRCYLWKDGRSLSVRLGDALLLEPGSLSRSETNGRTDFYFVKRGKWHFGGNALSHLSRWQSSRLWFLSQRHKLLRHYHNFGAEEEAYTVLAAMTLGDKSALNGQMRETFAVSGASHVLAISGLHIGIVYGLLTWLTLGRRRFWLSQLLTVAAIWAFAMLTGLSASVTRAAIMISLYAVFASRGGRASPVNVLCFAAIVMLVADVQTLFDIGFQLSFAAVFAILTFMPVLQAMFQPRNAILLYICNLCLVSLCAQMGVAPLLAYYFGRLPTYFLLTNFLVLPATMLILYGSFLSLVCPPASMALLWVVRLMNGGLRIIASLPAASIGGLNPSKTQVVLTYVFFTLCYAILRMVVPLNRINSAKNIQKRN